MPGDFCGLLRKNGLIQLRLLGAAGAEGRLLSCAGYAPLKRVYTGKGLETLDTEFFAGSIEVTIDPENSVFKVGGLRIYSTDGKTLLAVLHSPILLLTVPFRSNNIGIVLPQLRIICQRRKGVIFITNLKTIDGETLMSRPLQPLRFAVNTLISQGVQFWRGLLGRG